MNLNEFISFIMKDDYPKKYIKYDWEDKNDMTKIRSYLKLIGYFVRKREMYATYLN